MPIRAQGKISRAEKAGIGTIDTTYRIIQRLPKPTLNYGNDSSRLLRRAPVIGTIIPFSLLVGFMFFFPSLISDCTVCTSLGNRRRM
jgi:hypothetical protein